MSMQDQIGQNQTEMNETVTPSPANRVGVKLLYLALAVLAIAVGIFLYWSFQPDKVLEIKNSPFPTRTVTGEPNTAQVVIMNADYCKNIDVTGILRMSFTSDTREVFLPETPENSPVGCSEREIAVFLPKDLPNDRYHVHFHVTYNINPLKKDVIVEFQSASFDVKPGGIIDNIGEPNENDEQ